MEFATLVMRFLLGVKLVPGRHRNVLHASILILCLTLKPNAFISSTTAKFLSMSKEQQPSTRMTSTCLSVKDVTKAISGENPPSMPSQKTSSPAFAKNADSPFTAAKNAVPQKHA